MATPLTDEALKRGMNAAARADREDLWRATHEVATYFALVGDTRAAMTLWEYCYSGKIPMPEPDDSFIHVCGDGIIAAVCQQLGRRDLSRGKPPPKQIRSALSLANRVLAMDRRERSRLSFDAWSPICDWDNPSAKTRALVKYRDLRYFQESKLKRELQALESKCLPIMRPLFNDRKACSQVNHYHLMQAMLLVADIAARHGLDDEARDMLNRWHKQSVECQTDDVESAFSLVPIARLLCDGALSEKCRLRPKTRDRLVRQLLTRLNARLTRRSTPALPKWKYKLDVSHGQFYVEPRERDSEFTYFQEEGEHEQGFSACPGQIAFGTPGSDAQVEIEARIRSRLPAVGRAVQVVAVPLTVAPPGGVYLRTVYDGRSRRRLDIKPGTYDVVASIFSGRAKANRHSCFESWRVVLTFVPGGSIGAKCIKRMEGEPPTELTLH